MQDALDLIEDETETPADDTAPAWKVLVVDDDSEVHSVTRLALDNFTFLGRPLQILSAYSGAAARKLLDEHDDIALILLDVVMETEHAGLDLVPYIRETLGNRNTRIVLRTGQPGQAPARSVIINYDIDDYRTKTELTFDRLFVVTTTALRIYQLLANMEEHQRAITHQATHDALTGLPNRILLQDRLAGELAHARRDGSQLAMLFIDLDGFKFINDCLGHTVGDDMLRSVASRLRRLVRESDTVARLGGDEFVALVCDIGGEDDAIQIAQKVLEVMSRPFEIGGRRLLVTASVGISLYPRDGQDFEVLVKNADVALYGAKERGRNRLQVYDTALGDSARERVLLEGALREALLHDQFELYYQPRLRIADGQLTGVEALLRWHHPELGVVSPARFIPLAEEVGLIVPIGAWALRTACEQLQRWRKQGMTGLTMAVNMSARQFHEHDFPQLVRNTLVDTGVDPASLELEMTESALINNPDLVIGLLRELKTLGIKLAMDDFGTGYSSLSYLNRLPIDILKIDRSFTVQLGVNEEATSITQAIIKLAQFLHMETICEGVETPEQLSMLIDAGCDAIQGFYFSPALPAAEFERLAAQYQPKPLDPAVDPQA